jgi:4-hydroxythreonine-4-phosphate dehydrogenase
MNIIISQGDCNGIGIEVMIKSILDFDRVHEDFERHDLFISGSLETMEEYLGHFQLPVNFFSDSIQIGNRICPVIDCGNYSPVQFGQETESAGKLAAGAVETAVERTLAGEFDALVTMPVSKNSLYMAGWKFPGHTEMLADRCGVKNPMMILFKDSLRVALATIHVPVKSVHSLINAGLVKEKISTLNESLKRDFGRQNPSIAVLGLNPHAGESGAIGKEEVDIINPALTECQEKGLMAEGPFPADGFFAHGAYHNYDGILAMYHDQGLIPLKLLANGGGVNFTAGLPIVRTSPDHGTAFAIAGRDMANHSSSLDALVSAVEIAENRAQAK